VSRSAAANARVGATTNLRPVWCLSALVAATGIAASACAQQPQGMDAERPIAASTSVWLEELTWMEVRDRVAAGTTTVIIPTGGIEANGPFLSTGKHNVILEGLCPAIATRLGNALCAPVVKFVPEGSIEPPSGAMLYPGSISLRDETYVALLDDIASSLRQAGFEDIVMIGDSGGNQAGMRAAAEMLNERWRDDAARAHFIVDFYTPGWEETERYTEEVLGVAETRNDGHHDDIWVTAMMAVSDPEQIRYEQRVDAGLASINGVDIEPLEATVDLGRKMIDFRAELTARAIRAAIGSDGRR
jgi:creatinine amidohydrolase/Fe(II)-dependent formamide hydrolase-like protein